MPPGNLSRQCSVAGLHAASNIRGRRWARGVGCHDDEQAREGWVGGECSRGRYGMRLDARPVFLPARASNRPAQVKVQLGVTAANEAFERDGR